MEKNSDISQESKSKKYVNTFLKAIMFLLTILVSTVAAYFYHKTVVQTAGVGILAAAGFGSVLFAIEQSKEDDSFLFDNKEHLGLSLIHI